MFIARYGNQDLHQLRGVEQFTDWEKAIIRAWLSHHLECEMKPAEDHTKE